jgi:hypothetical protein
MPNLTLFACQLTTADQLSVAHTGDRDPRRRTGPVVGRAACRRPASLPGRSRHYGDRQGHTTAGRTQAPVTLWTQVVLRCG